MGIKGLKWNDVDERVPVIAARRASFTTGDLCSTLTALACRLRLDDHRAHQQRLDEICRFLKAHYGGRAAVEATLRDAMKEAFIAGIYAAAECEYVPGNAEIARLLAEAKAQLRTATPEADQSPQAPQANGENGVTGG